MAEVWPKTSEGKQVKGVASGHPSGPLALLSSGKGDYLQNKKNKKKTVLILLLAFRNISFTNSNVKSLRINLTKVVAEMLVKQCNLEEHEADLQCRRVLPSSLSGSGLSLPVGAGTLFCE